MEYKDLNDMQKSEFKRICDLEFGQTFTFVGESKEPLYFNEKHELLPNNQLIDLLFNQNNN